MEGRDEQELVRRANRGDAAALEALYRAHRDWVAGLALRFTGDRADALDVLQETFLYLFGKFPGLALTASLRSFLYPVVKHHAVSVIRRRRRVVDLDSYRRDPAGEAELGWHGPADEAGDLQRRVASLAVEQREVVRLRFGLDFSLEEIATALEVPLGTVKSRLHNALKALRGAVAAEVEGKRAGS